MARECVEDRTWTIEAAGSGRGRGNPAKIWQFQPPATGPAPTPRLD
jgi:hypothetical protein